MVVTFEPSGRSVRSTLISSWPLASLITRSVMVLPAASTMDVGAEMMEPSTLMMEPAPAPMPVFSVPCT